MNAKKIEAVGDGLMELLILNLRALHGLETI